MINILKNAFISSSSYKIIEESIGLHSLNPKIKHFDVFFVYNLTNGHMDCRRLLALIRIWVPPYFFIFELTIYLLSPISVRTMAQFLFFLNIHCSENIH